MKLCGDHTRHCCPHMMAMFLGFFYFRSERFLVNLWNRLNKAVHISHGHLPVENQQLSVKELISVCVATFFFQFLFSQIHQRHLKCPNIVVPGGQLLISVAPWHYLDSIVWSINNFIKCAIYIYIYNNVQLKRTGQPRVSFYTISNCLKVSPSKGKGGCIIWAQPS